MSSILKALKKLEKETPRDGDSQPYPVDVKRTVENQVTKKQKYYKLLLILFSAIIIISLSVFLLTGQNVSKEKNSSDGALIVRKAIPARPVKENVKIASVPDFKSSKRRKRPSARIKKAKKPPGYSKVRTSASKEATKDKSSTNTRTKPKFARPSLPFKPSGVSGLKLQAIAWSSNSKDRICVVNGRILHEGSSIDGALIFRIDKNDVSFQKEGERWKQKFGTR
ncbi:MAG: GspB domain-containing protein [Desulfobacterales bacterium]|nr:general secretion pathway protein GspB [Deltaproteobacteria bacterium]NNL40862.1 GspB domain-containing protein [Desulfobacterales bacterium]